MSSSTQNLFVPGAIVIAGIIIAIAIVMSGGASSAAPAAGGTLLEAEVDPVVATDHVRGAAEPDVYLIEFSDFRCGFCGVFHSTAKQLLEEYEGLAWVYRHTPYQPGGYEAAVASECAAELGGAEMFWTFADAAFADQGALSEEWYAQFAADQGLDAEAFAACQADTERHDALFESHTTNAQALGAQGTPYSVLLTKEGNMVKFSGALPIDRVRPLVDRALASLE